MSAAKTPVYASAGKHKIKQNTSTCPLGKSCHVFGKGIVRFGDAHQFTSAFVKERAARTVAIKTPTNLIIASGVIIESKPLTSNERWWNKYRAGWRCLVLMASHTRGMFAWDEMKIVWPYYLPEGRAPGGSWQERQSDEAYIGELPTTYLSGSIKEVLEDGGFESDYAIVVADIYAPVGSSLVLDGTGQRLGKQIDYSGQLLSISHPQYKTHHCMPMQASAGMLLSSKDKYHKREQAPFNSYTSISAWSGSSGGGVYNTDGELVGLVRGAHSDCSDCLDKSTDRAGVAILNIYHVVFGPNSGKGVLADLLCGKSVLPQVST